MSLRGSQTAARYSDLGLDLSSLLRPQRPKRRTADLPKTARLLRNSRLFALPKPLKRPSNAQSENIWTAFESQTATLPYPTHAAIITHKKALSRGDWGLKRALPDRAFRTTTPVVRIGKVDNIDHITEFESAADHVFTLEKFQEMNLAVTIPRTADLSSTFSGRLSRAQTSTSAFDQAADPKTESKQLSAADKDKEQGWGVREQPPKVVRRWKYDSPWVAGMDAGDFQAYIESTIKQKKVPFRNWLEKRLAEERRQGQRASSKSRSDGETEESRQFASNIVSDITEGTAAPAPNTLEADIRDLRNHPVELWRLIWEFLDLPGRFPSTRKDLNDYTNDTVDIEQGPPVTHPSAGLSYLRPVRQLHNHPSLGPMADAAPVRARYLQRAGMRGGRDAKQIMGVGGMAVQYIDLAHRDNMSQGSTAQGLKQQGGPKTWVVPYDASVDSKGRVQMKVSMAPPDTAEIWNPSSRRGGRAEARDWRSGQSNAGFRRMPEMNSEQKRPTPQYKKVEDVKGLSLSEIMAKKPQE